MARKKGGLGQAAAVEVKEDLLDSVFGAPKAAPKPEADTPRPPHKQRRAKARKPPRAKKIAWANIFSSTATWPRP